MRHYQNYCIRFDTERDATEVIADIKQALGQDSIYKINSEMVTVGKKHHREVIKLSVYLDEYFLRNNPPQNPGVYEGAEPLLLALGDVDGFETLTQEFGA